MKKFKSTAIIRAVVAVKLQSGGGLLFYIRSLCETFCCAQNIRIGKLNFTQLHVRLSAREDGNEQVSPAA